KQFHAQWWLWELFEQLRLERDEFSRRWYQILGPGVGRKRALAIAVLRVVHAAVAFETAVKRLQRLRRLYFPISLVHEDGSFRGANLGLGCIEDPTGFS
uniref:Uncharacterized protein n=1 Tax=Romanomermis culicivorax TaxID=13658 RepID=A0A915J6X7_ROMCU